MRVLRAHVDLPWLPNDNPLAQVISANHQVVQLGARLAALAGRRRARPRLAGCVGRRHASARPTRAPLVATIHATELGRHRGHLTGTTSEAINACEWWLTYQAQRVICCSGFMVEEVVRSFQLPRDKITMVPNGVEPSRFRADRASTRAGADAPLIVSWGRLQYEKGFQTLIAAVARLVPRWPALALRARRPRHLLRGAARRRPRARVSSSRCTSRGSCATKSSCGC